MNSNYNILRNDSNIISQSQKSMVVSFFVPIIGLYCQYSLFINTIGLTLAFIISIFLILKSGMIWLNKPFAFFSIFYIIRLGINFFGPYAVFSQKTLVDWLVIIIVSFCSLELARYIDQDVLFKVWNVIGYILILIILYQSFQCYVLGTPVSIVKIGPVSSTDYVWNTVSLRPSACFTEPAMYAIYMAPLLHMNIYRKKYFQAVMISVSLILSTSTIGIISVVVLFGADIILNKDISKRKKIVLTFLVIAGGFLAINATAFSTAFTKISNEMSGTSNSYVRVQWGYNTFSQLNWGEKIFGIMDQSIESLRLSGRIDPVVINKKMYSYANTFQIVLITSGFIGVVLWGITHFKLFNAGDYRLKIFLVLQIVLMFGSKCFFSSIALIPYIYMFSLIDDKYYSSINLMKRH